MHQHARLIGCNVIDPLLQVTGGPDYTLEIVLVIIVGLTIVILVIAHFRERERQLAVAEKRRQRQMSRVPEHLDNVARRLGGDD